VEAVCGVIGLIFAAIAVYVAIITYKLMKKEGNISARKLVRAYRHPQSVFH
jgi:hypothetical protein